MPRFDKTGPRAMGPGTGRGLGTCKTCARCYKCGCPCCSYSKEMTKEEKIEMFKNEEKAIKKEIEDLQK